MTVYPPNQSGRGYEMNKTKIIEVMGKEGIWREFARISKYEAGGEMALMRAVIEKIEEAKKQPTAQRTRIITEKEHIDRPIPF